MINRLSETMISVEDIEVKYIQRNFFSKNNQRQALSNISFDLYKGDSLGIIGRNGAGKSTLLRLLAGIIIPDSGRVINRGYKTALLSLQVGFVPQLSGRDNAVLSGMLLGFSKKEIEIKIDEIFKLAELKEYINFPLHAYSNGMKARLGFSVAHYLDPDILLIDEILAVGDADFRRKSLEIMQNKLLSDQTIVLISHNAKLVKKLCNRVIWIEHGTMRMEGDADSVVSCYETSLNTKNNSKYT